MNTNVTGFTPLNTIRVLNNGTTTIAQGAPLGITGYVYIMDSTLSPRTLPDGATQTTRLRIPTVADIRDHDPALSDEHYVGIARDPIPACTQMSPIPAPLGTWAQDGIGDCILEGVCYVAVTIPAGGADIDMGDPLYFDDAADPQGIATRADIDPAGTEYPRQVGIALSELAADVGVVTGIVLAFIDQFPRVSATIT